MFLQLAYLHSICCVLASTISLLFHRDWAQSLYRTVSGKDDGQTREVAQVQKPTPTVSVRFESEENLARPNGRCWDVVTKASE